MTPRAENLCMASVYRTVPQNATLYYDTEKLRMVLDYRRVNPRCLRLETRELLDYDPIQQRWTTYGAARTTYVEGTKGQCDKAWAAVIAEIEASPLRKDEHNSNWAHAHYYI